ncbi:transposase [Thalassotalea agarivorans]|uniref:Transposase IS200-like domain-containing protein n=1 Tax=Thalassotalea agarivorans TaxID=349064 RepID=A0A1I0CL76_THASX|nr:transposase [Thalassotalea agarivorans]SET19944.1 hypothetical protein SAMN05660429_01226 [Thalassotalea agarivorans]
MTIARSNQICLHTTTYYHCVSRCVRRAFLCGKDRISGKSYEHRRAWVEHRMLSLARSFCIEICAYAIMHNHTHIVLNVKKDLAESLTDTEVINRWHKLTKGTHLTRQFIQEGSVPEPLKSQLKCDIEKFRSRLFSISWFMKLLNEFIAKHANIEDECTGRFWEGRFVSQPLLDEKAVLACMAYVDLNPVRAGIVRNVKAGQYTSISRRLAGRGQCLMPFAAENTRKSSSASPFSITFGDYLSIINIKLKQENVVAINATQILSKIGFDLRTWRQVTQNFELYFYGAVGTVSSLDKFIKNTRRKRRPNVQNAKKYFG